ncbi:MAG: response regulator [Planctomycetes bacterium]|nr:response regulator [Planctomycetota bacterium]
MIARLAGWVLKRKRIYVVGLVVGLVGIAASGIISAPFQAAPVTVKIAEKGDTLYHYHVSAVMATALSLLALLILGTYNARHVSRQPLRATFGSLLVIDFFSIIGGAIAAFAFGWLKELSDFMGGDGASRADLEADYMGVAALCVCALAAVMPLHGIVTLAGDKVRWLILRSLSPKHVRSGFDKAIKVERQINDNSEALKTNSKALAMLNDEIGKLSLKLESMSAEERSGEEGLAVISSIKNKKDNSASLLRKLAELESDNERLRGELKVLSSSLRGTPGSEVILGDIRDLHEQCAVHAVVVAECVKKSEAVSEYAHEIVNEPGTAGAEEAPAPVENIRTEAGSPTDSEELGMLKRQLEARHEHEEEMAKEIGELKAHIEELSQNEGSADNERVEKLEAAVAMLRRKILVVDDEKFMVSLISEMLNTAGIFDIESALNVPQALKVLQNGTFVPDLVVLDINMPGISGVQFCEALEKGKKTKHINVIFCSAMLPESVPELAKLSHSGFIRKPFTKDQLFAAVFKAIGINHS